MPKRKILDVHIDEEGNVNVGFAIGLGALDKLIPEATERAQQGLGEAIKARLHKKGEVRTGQNIAKLRKDWKGKRDEVKAKRKAAHDKKEKKLKAEENAKTKKEKKP